MNLEKRAELFRQLRTKYAGFIYSMIWKLTGDRELFTEAVQYTLLGMWQNVEKLKTEKAGGYIYRIALSANSRAWRNRIGKNGHFDRNQTSNEEKPVDDIARAEQAEKVRKAISLLPAKQGKARVMRYLDQQDYESIAGKLRCSRTGARSHVSKALATLKKKLTTFSELEVEK